MVFELQAKMWRNALDADDDNADWLLGRAMAEHANWRGNSSLTGADPGFLLGGGRRLRGGIFPQLQGRHVPEGHQHINDGAECA